MVTFYLELLGFSGGETLYLEEIMNKKLFNFLQKYWLLLLYLSFSLFFFLVIFKSGGPNPIPKIRSLLEKEKSVDVEIFGSNFDGVYKKANLNSKMFLELIPWDGFQSKEGHRTSGIYDIVLEFQNGNKYCLSFHKSGYLYLKEEESNRIIYGRLSKDVDANKKAFWSIYNALGIKKRKKGIWREPWEMIPVSQLEVFRNLLEKNSRMKVFSNEKVLNGEYIKEIDIEDLKQCLGESLELIDEVNFNENNNFLVKFSKGELYQMTFAENEKLYIKNLLENDSKKVFVSRNIECNRKIYNRIKVRIGKNKDRL
jgi:hypothetical protein